jgi:hypothetical protein
MQRFGAERSEIEQLNASTDKFMIKELIVDNDLKTNSVSPARCQIKGRKSVTPTQASHSDNIELKKKKFEQKQF